MDVLWQELTRGLPDGRQLAIVLIRVIAAMLLGGIIGMQREKARKPAGLRTHMMVCLGTAVVVLACIASSMDTSALSRVVQGIVTGIGFIGAGSILKLSEQREIRGLTTAAGLWVTAAIGVAVGLGSLGLALIGTALTLLVLGVVGAIEARIEKRQQNL
ncbi:MAG TPA: MgtC/SapB family protein [Pyrinomonadaceae bacterium]|jgi:putative Mg2+ transporter-C (MgtC) family protein|nr:MgtC/SapB family protein [Pyrinomonadaceae bacterium]